MRIPSMLRLESAGNKRKKKRLEDHVHNNRITPNKRTMSLSDKKKGFSHLPKKKLSKSFSTSAQQRKKIQNNYDRLHDLLECHKSCLFFFSVRSFLFFCVPFIVESVFFSLCFFHLFSRRLSRRTWLRTDVYTTLR